MKRKAAGGGASPRTISSVPPTPINDLRSPVYLANVVAPSPAARVGRIFGYLGLVVVWAAILAVGIFATVLALPGAAGAAAPEGLSDSQLFRHSDTWLAVFVLPLLALIFGAISVFIVTASLGALLAAATLFVRSLNPAYAGEQLSLSILTKDGEAVGPESTAFTGVALSLIPVRLTRWTKIIVMIQFNAWLINSTLLLIGFLWGCTYLFAVGWMLWPVTGAGAVVCAVLSALPLVGIVWVVWRRRARFAEVVPTGAENSVYLNSWPRRTR